MGTSCGKTLTVSDSAIVSGFTDRTLVHGPRLLLLRPMICYTVNVIERRELTANQWLLSTHIRDPRQTRVIRGPTFHTISDPWEEMGPTTESKTLTLNQFALEEDSNEPMKNKYVTGPTKWFPETQFKSLAQIKDAIVLDANDYIIVSSPSGSKRTISGPAVYVPTYGERWTSTQEAVNVPVNNFIIVDDSSDHEQPVRHVCGPCKYYPQPFQKVVGDVLSCFPVNSTQTLWVQKTDGHIYMIQNNEPVVAAGAAAPAIHTAIGRWYMPLVGEKVLKTMSKTVLQPTQFSIIIGSNGVKELKRGDEESTRAYFLPPYYTVFAFDLGSNGGVKQPVQEFFTTLPVIIKNTYRLRTNDNVELDLDTRVQFEVTDPAAYSSQPLSPLYDQISNWVQKELLNAYTRLPFRDFQATFSDACGAAKVDAVSMFARFGITLSDIQVVGFQCTNAATQALLQTDVQTRVTKQNELRAAAVDVDIQEKRQALTMKQKDLELAVAMREVAIRLQRQEAENGVALSKLQLAIKEEQARTALVEAQRHNAVTASKFEGQAQGAYIFAFHEALPPGIENAEKTKLWEDLLELSRSAMLYSRAKIQMTSEGTTLTQVTLAGGSDRGGGGSSGGDDGGVGKFLSQQPLLLPAILGASAMNSRGGMFVPNVLAVTHGDLRSASTTVESLPALPPIPAPKRA